MRWQGQKNCVTLFPLWSLKKTVVGYIDTKQQKTYEKFDEVDIVLDTDILLMLLLLMIIIIIILLLVLILLLLPLTKVLITVIIIITIT